MSLLIVPSACRVMLSLGWISQPSLYLKKTMSRQHKASNYNVIKLKTLNGGLYTVELVLDFILIN